MKSGEKHGEGEREPYGYSVIIAAGRAPEGMNLVEWKFVHPLSHREGPPEHIAAVLQSHPASTETQRAKTECVLPADESTYKLEGDRQDPSTPTESVQATVPQEETRPKPPTSEERIAALELYVQLLIHAVATGDREPVKELFDQRMAEILGAQADPEFAATDAEGFDLSTAEEVLSDNPREDTTAAAKAILDKYLRRHND